jgi:hypothetical protein
MWGPFLGDGVALRGIPHGKPAMGKTGIFYYRLEGLKMAPIDKSCSNATLQPLEHLQTKVHIFLEAL